MSRSKTTVAPSEHVVQFYDRDEQLVEGVAHFLSGALQRGNAVIVVATDAHRQAFAARLRSAGLDVDGAADSGQYLALDAATTMASFMVDGAPDPGAFDANIGALVRKAQVPGRQLCIFGEMVALLWADGQVPAAVELERLWNRLGDQEPFSLLCAYASDLMGAGSLLAEFDLVCHLHSAIVGGSSDDIRRGVVGGASGNFARAYEAPRAARHFVIDTLGEWGLGHLCDDAALVVTELATNAVLHGQSDFRVVLSATPTSVRISVADNSGASPGCQDFSSGASSGRGLGLVSALSCGWGTAHVGEGKVVWADLAR